MSLTNKKIGIITLPTLTNYGGILQAYALHTVLSRLGYESEVIEKYLYPRQLSAIQKAYLYPFRFIKKYVFNKQCGIRTERNLKETAMDIFEIAKFTKTFINEYIPHRYVYDFHEINRNDYSAFIVGSDQIWRPKYVRGYRMTLDDAFLGFAHNWVTTKISYSASFGSNGWEYTPEETTYCKKLLQSFSAVSCREESGVRFCQSILGYQKATMAIDPTLLLSAEDYNAIIDKLKNNDDTRMDDGGIMSYILDKSEEKDLIISYAQKHTGYNLCEIGANTNSREGTLEGRYLPLVESWLEGFKKAKLIITDSYHACVFSIIYRKSFIAIANLERGNARFDSLLKMFDLENRLLHSYSEKQIQAIIDVPLSINEGLLKAEQQRSFDYLKANLLAV